MKIIKKEINDNFDWFGRFQVSAWYHEMARDFKLIIKTSK